MMNCIIIDNNVNNKLLGELMAKCSSLNLIGTYSDSASTLNQLSKQHSIDLAFINLETVRLDNPDLINSLNNQPFFIAVSSDGQYAKKAFDYNFVDYLVKPVSYSRFYRAIDKTMRCNSQRESSNIGKHEIFIKKDSSLIRLNMKDITYIEALENYIILNTHDNKYTFHITMKGIEYQLPPEIFTRVHRSFIVNKRLIKTINENCLQITLGNKLKTLPIGKSFRDTLLNDISVINKK